MYSVGVGRFTMMDGDDYGEGDGGNDNVTRVKIVTETAVAYDIDGGIGDGGNSDG